MTVGSTIGKWWASSIVERYLDPHVWFEILRDTKDLPY
jgi:hypothetical protein